MGLFSSIVSGVKSFVGGIFGGSSSDGGSSSGYNYEPDKVRVAEIERDTKLKLADKEIEKIELMKDAQIEILQAQALTQVAIEKARAEGMKELATYLLNLQERMLQIAQQRMEIIEKGSLPIIREIETFYNEIGEKIQADSDAYNTEKLPKLLQILNQYEKDSPAHQLYFAQIQNDMARQGVFIEQQLQKVGERQNLVLQSFLKSKEKILDQTAQITGTLANKLLEEKVQNALPPAQEMKALPEAN